MRTLELVLALAFPTLMLAAAPAATQYKWIAPNGAVTYSDQPPPTGMNGHALSGMPVAPGSEAGVPGALREATTKYPVVLYSTSDCAPCQQARAHLSKRGIPFVERTVTTTSDAESFKKAGFVDNNFPSVSVGRERAVGFEAGEWNRLLDAAGYPKSSVLPPSFKQAPAKALAGGDRTGARANDAADAGEADGAGADTARPRPRSAPSSRADAPPAPRDPNALRF